MPRSISSSFLAAAFLAAAAAFGAAFAAGFTAPAAAGLAAPAAAGLAAAAATGLAAALSMGDLGVIALFAGQAEETLPLAMYRLMGAYRMETAASAALLLLGLSLVLFWICDRGGRADADV